MKKLFTTVMLSSLAFIGVQAQVSTNPDKFLGNITTSYNVDAGGGVPAFYKLWNQITCENESKWASVEGTRGSFNWGCDKAFNYAKQHNFTYKFHALVWGSQYPSWIEKLSYTERHDAIVNWYNAVKNKYAELPLIDVVNEAVEGHQQGTHFMKEALGGGGKTGYDWLITAFDMASERWPDAILIYNDFNTFQWNTDQYINLVKALRDGGAPIDAYGCQSHDLGGVNQSTFKNVMTRIQNALKMPMYITEYDIGDANDANQKWNYQQHFPVMWEADYCAGVTLWGYVYGKTWVTDGNSGIYKDGKERSAMTWLKEYMATDAAKNAVSPFPGMKKEASIYIRPAAMKVAKDDVLPIKVHARLATKTIEKVDFYVNDELVQTMTEAPYIVEYTASTVGTKTAKAVVTATDGSTYERQGSFTVARGTQREPFTEAVPQIPGTINATEYDKGMSGVTYSNASRTLTATKDGQWMEYTIDVAEDGFYALEAEVAASNANGIFHLAEYTLDKIVLLSNYVSVPNTGSTSTYQTVRCPLKEYLTAGRHVFCLNIDKGNFYIKSMTFKHTPTFTLPGTIEAEDFYQGGDGVDIVSGNGGYVVSNAGNGKWMDYSVNVTKADKYTCEATVSADVTNAKFTISLVNSDGTLKNLTTVSVPYTGSKDVYQVKTVKIRNAIGVEGLQTLRLTVTSGNCNIDKVNMYLTDATGIDDIEGEAAEAPAHNLMGVPVGAGYRGIVIKNGKKTIKQ